MTFFTTFAEMEDTGKIASTHEKYAPNVDAHFDQKDNVKFDVRAYNDDELGEWFTVQIETADHYKNPDGMELTIYLSKEQLAQLGAIVAHKVSQNELA